MQVSTSKSSSKKSIVELLIGIGYSKEKAENLYYKYKSWGKLNKLEEYIMTKQSLTPNYDSIPLRDM